MSLSVSPATNPASGDFADDFSYMESKTYLNNASVSLMPRQSMDAMRDFLLEYNSAGPDSSLADDLVTEKAKSVRRIISGIISCQPDEIVLTNSTTDGINMVATGLDSLVGGSNLVIRGMGHEHHANLYPWLYLRDKGVQIRSLPIDAHGLFEMDLLRSFLDARTELIAMSHALYNTGAILPVDDVGRVVHGDGDGYRSGHNNGPDRDNHRSRRNMDDGRSRNDDHRPLFFLDAAQTVGCLAASDCNVSRIRCDFMSFNGSKWLCGPMGMGLFYCSREAGRLLRPVMIGGESAMLYDDNDDAIAGNDVRDADPGYPHTPHIAFKDAPDKFQTGFRNYVGVAGLEASLKYLVGIGFERIRALNRNLSGLLLDELERLPHVVTYAPADRMMRTSIVPFNVEGMDPHRVVELLEKQGIVLAVREMNDLVMVRASPHFFNTEEQMHRLVGALGRL